MLAFFVSFSFPAVLLSSRVQRQSRAYGARRYRGEQANDGGRGPPHEWIACHDPAESDNLEAIESLTQMNKGYLIVFTGDGKGKTTAALGMSLRAAGHGMKILILQFIKGAWSYGELKSIEKMDEVTICPLGTGFTWKKENLDQDRELARKGWQRAREEMQSGHYDMIILDEMNIVLSYGLLPLEEVIEGLMERPPGLHIVVTGRDAPEELIRLADLVTEMRLIKHPFRDQGIRAQKGIEF